MVRFKFIKSLIGIETSGKTLEELGGERFKFIKSLIGIETQQNTDYIKYEDSRFKFIKSLIGIETDIADTFKGKHRDSNSSNP